MKRKGVIFAQLEKFNKVNYPQFIKLILIENGFDTAAALKLLNKRSVENLEIIVNKKKEFLKNTTYIDKDGQLKITPFKFKIGHETLLLNFPKDLSAYLEHKNNYKKLKISELNIDDINISFVDKVVSYLSEKNIEGSVSSEYLSAFNKTTKNVKCLAKCLYCPSQITCTFDSSWRISNYLKHIVACSKTTVNESIEIQSKIQRAEQVSVLHEVQNIVQNVV